MKSAVLVILVVMGLSPAFAHPFTIDTIPDEFSNIPVGETEIVVVYSESVEIDFSTLRVIDGSGRQVDNRDTAYHEGEHSLRVTTPPLGEGVYTVTSKVLSKVDGHLVDYAFIFAVGEAAIDQQEREGLDEIELIFFPEAGARFPGLVGQTVALGAVLASILIWGTQRKDLIGEELAGLRKVFHDRFMVFVGVGLALVFASNIVMLVIQSWRLEVDLFEVLGTSSGLTWMIRMAVTVALLAVWFHTEYKKRLARASQILLLALLLVLLGTTTMMGHGMASEQPHAVVLDYIHNFAAAAWIGGIAFLVFVLLPSLGTLGSNIKDRIALASIPRFTTMVSIVLGVVIITGPLLMWSLEDDLDDTVESTYGRLITLKVLLASGMIGIGAYHQFAIQRGAERDSTMPVIRRMKRMLRVETALGVALLGVVAVLANATLPGGEVGGIEDHTAIQGFSALEFTEDARFEIEVFPHGVGSNMINVKVTDPGGNPLSDLDDLRVKISNPEHGVFPIVIQMEDIKDDMGIEFNGNASFGFSGIWQMEVEAQRTEHANDAVMLNLLIKPHLEDLRVEIIEYDLPGTAAPLQPRFDGRGGIWISDTAGPQIWRFSIAEESFTRYGFEGNLSTSISIGNDGRVWFTDTTGGKIGYVDPSGEIVTMRLPDMPPVNESSYPTAIDSDGEDGIWVAITNKDLLVRYDQRNGTFETHTLEAGSRPFTVAVDESGMVWTTQQGTGSIGYMNPATGERRELSPDPPLAVPETITFDRNGNLWISEHQAGGGIVKYSPLLETFERIPFPDERAFPNSVVFDRYQNAWFALHTVDGIAAYDPHREEMLVVPIDTPESWALFTTVDGEENIWFAEQKAGKLAMLHLTETAAAAASHAVPRIEEEAPRLGYAEVVAPLVGLEVVIASLFFVKSIWDRRRIDALVYEQEPARDSASQAKN